MGLDRVGEAVEIGLAAGGEIDRASPFQRLRVQPRPGEQRRQRRRGVEEAVDVGAEELPVGGDRAVGPGRRGLVPLLGQPQCRHQCRAGSAGGSRGGYGGQAYGGGQGGYGKREESFKDLTAPIPKAMAQAKSEAGFKVGQAVFHNKFGEGVILTLEGNGGDARVQVNFGRHGTKWLMLSVAKLTPIE